MIDIAKIISGGQTGADRGGLDAAIEREVPHGGWCPKGRRAEDGKIPVRYQLHETKGRNYLIRTEQNIINSHATVVFTYGKPTGGSRKTVELARQHYRPCLSLDLNETDDEKLAREILGWFNDGGPQVSRILAVPRNPVLNVAGSRESKAPGIQERVKQVMMLVLDPPFYPPGSE